VLECRSKFLSVSRGLPWLVGLYLTNWRTGEPGVSLGDWMGTKNKHEQFRHVISSHSSDGMLLLAVSFERVVLGRLVVDVAAPETPQWNIWSMPLSEFAGCEEPSCELRGETVVSDIGDAAEGRFAVTFPVRIGHASASSSWRLAIVDRGESGIVRRLYCLPGAAQAFNVFRSPRGSSQLLVERVSGTQAYLDETLLRGQT